MICVYFTLVYFCMMETGIGEKSRKTFCGFSLDLGPRDGVEKIEPKEIRALSIKRANAWKSKR